MEKVLSVVRNKSGEITRVITQSGKEIAAEKAILLVKSGRLGDLRIQTSPFTGKVTLGLIEIQAERKMS